MALTCVVAVALAVSAAVNRDGAPSESLSVRVTRWALHWAVDAHTLEDSETVRVNE